MTMGSSRQRCLSSWSDSEIHDRRSAEGTSGAAMAGAGGVAQIGNLGVVNFAAAVSGVPGDGRAVFSGAQRIGRVFSIGGSAIIANRDYRDVASMNGDGVQRKQLSGFASLYFKRFGSLGAAYSGIDQDATPTPIPFGVTSAEHSHVASGNYSLQFHRVTIYASAFKDFARWRNSGLRGHHHSFGSRSSVNVSGTSDGSVQVQAQKSAALIGEWGYDAYVSAGNSQHEFGQVQYKSSVGLFTAGVDQSDGLTTVRLESQGAISWVDKGFSRPTRFTTVSRLWTPVRCRMYTSIKRIVTWAGQTPRGGCSCRTCARSI